jgi:type III restriction enzyme
MIKRTIKEHLDKEKRLRPQGIKVLSLFFIDAVDKYRQYDGEGNKVNGDYARIFEEEYSRLAKHPDYQTLFQEVDLTFAAAEVHDGWPQSAVWLRATLQRRVSLCGSPLAMFEVLRL